MPELPEVQTIASELHKKIKNKKIKRIEVRVPKLVNLPVLDFEKKVKNKIVKSVSRRAKMIIIDLGADHFLLIHLKMTGQLVYVQKSGKKISGGHPVANIGELPNKFSHIIFEFSDESKLFFNDIRKFGWIKYADKKLKDKEMEKYGIEPFTSEYVFSDFDKVFKKYPNRKVKQILLDQSLIAGVGNIYADESCFEAGIMPTRKASTLKPQEIKKLFNAIPKILKLAIEKGGTSADTYIRTDGSQGQMMKYLKVYGRKGKKCKIKKCQGVIQKMRLVGRGTYFCQSCQQ